MIPIVIEVHGSVAELRSPLTDRPMMAALGALQSALIKDRTVHHGKGLDDTPLKPYGTRPMYVYPGKGIGLRLRPKGGRKTKGGGHFYEGGYAQYKAASTKRGGASHVDYTASGRTMASLRPLRISRTKVTVGFSGGEARRIAGWLNARSAFFGVGKGDDAELTEEAGFQVK